MQKKLTVYGVADMYVKKTWGSGHRVTGVDSGGENGARIGFRGSEELGNGLKAIFDFQCGSIPMGQSVGLTTTRQAFVGLAGYFQSIYFDPGMAHFFSAYQHLTRGIAAAGVGASINTGWNAASWRNNTTEYELPAFGGLKTSLAYGFGEQDNSPREGFSPFGLEYTTGPLRLGYVFQSISNIGGTSTDQREHFLGASYNFGMVPVMGSWQNARVDASGASAATDKVWDVGAKVMVAPATHVLLGYAKADVDASASDGKSYTIGLVHSLSKRTHLYGGYGRVTNDDQTAPFNWREFPIDGAGAAPFRGESINTVGFGISHLF